MESDDIYKSSKSYYYEYNKKVNKNNVHYGATKTKYYKGILDPNSTPGIAVITEHLVSKILGDCVNCNILGKHNSAYDLISDRYGTINVKSSKLLKIKNSKYTYWSFCKLEKASIPDYYICLGFDENRLTIPHVWIIPGNTDVIPKTSIIIYNTDKGLNKFKNYEQLVLHYNFEYANLDIYSLPEFRNLNSNIAKAGEIADEIGKGIVEEVDVRLANERLEIDRIVEVVKTLPTQSKLVLLSCIYTYEHMSKRECLTGNIYNIYKKFCIELDIDILTQRRVSDLITELDMLGIVNAVVVSKGRHGRTKEVVLDTNWRLLKNYCFEGAVINEEFYKRVCEMVYFKIDGTV